MGDPPLRAFIEELKRRHVFRVAVAYLVVAWVVIEVASTVFPPLELPAWSVRLVIVLAVLGFPIALVLAWAFQMTPEGPRRVAADARAEAEVAAGAPSPETPGAPPSARRAPVVALVAVVALALAAAVYVLRSPEDGARAARASATTAGLSAFVQLTFSAGVEEYPAFSPEGERVAFSRDVEGYRQIYVRSLVTGQEVAATDEPLDHIQPAWSPDGRSLLYVRAKGPAGKLEPADVHGAFVGGELWRADVAGGGHQRVAEDAYNPAFSPDGRHLAFDASRAGTRRIWVADAAGRNPRQLTDDASEAVAHVAPAWSPDGSWIAFQNIEKTKFDIRAVEVASGRMTWLTDDLFRDVRPVWSRDGSEVFFSSPRGGGMNLWRIAVGSDGTPEGPPRQITTGAGQDLHPAVSPDGSRLAFAILAQNGDLWRLPLEPGRWAPAGPAEPLVVTTREENRGAPSPDGRWVAFNSDRAGEMNLWLLSLADGTTQQLTSGPGGDYQPRWSPEGRALVFFSSRSGNADIWTVEVATGQLRQLTDDPSLDVNPFFSPDGRRIAFQSDRGGRKEAWVMGADGSGARPVTTGGAGDHFMVWMPDGRSLLVNAPTVVRRVFLDGSTPRDLPGIRGGAHMSLSPDGRWVLDVVGHHTVWLSPLEGGEPRRVFEFEEPEVRIDYPAWSADGRFVVFDRHVPMAGDIWMLELEGLGGGR